MNIFATLNCARKYFEVMAAYNIDRFRLQSMLSTAHKLLRAKRAIDQQSSVEELQAQIATISDYWFYKTAHSPLFAQHEEDFQFVRDWAEKHQLSFNTSEASFGTDPMCRHMLVLSPYTGGHEVFDLETGKSFAIHTLPVREPTPASAVSIDGVSVPLYNFTRRECDASVGGLISHTVSR